MKPVYLLIQERWFDITGDIPRQFTSLGCSDDPTMLPFPGRPLGNAGRYRWHVCELSAQYGLRRTGCFKWLHETIVQDDMYEALPNAHDIEVICREALAGSLSWADLYSMTDAPLVVECNR